MKLYFYILGMDEKSRPIIRTKECEAEKRSGTYYPVQGRFPVGYGYARPKDIGILKRSTIGYEKIYVITQEPDLNLAKRLFVQNIDERIEVHKKRIAFLEKHKTAIETTEETEEW